MPIAAWSTASPTPVSPTPPAPMGVSDWSKTAPVAQASGPQQNSGQINSAYSTINKVGDFFGHILGSAAAAGNFVGNAIGTGFAAASKAVQVPGQIASQIEDEQKLNIVKAYNDSKTIGENTGDLIQPLVKSANQKLLDQKGQPWTPAGKLGSLNVALIAALPDIASQTIDQLLVPAIISATDGTSLATKTITGEILTPDDLRTIANDPKSNLSQPIKDGLNQMADNNLGLKGSGEVPAGGIRQTVGRVLGGSAKNQGSATIVRFLADGTSEEIPVTPEGARITPFSGAEPSGPQRSVQPFNNEPGAVDRVQEPFTGKVTNQLPDRVVQVPGGFHTIPIDQAHSVISGVPNENVVEKSPSQMAALGQENLGSVNVGAETIGDKTIGDKIDSYDKQINDIEDKTPYDELNKNSEYSELVNKRAAAMNLAVTELKNKVGVILGRDSSELLSAIGITDRGDLGGILSYQNIKKMGSNLDDNIQKIYNVLASEKNLPSVNKVDYGKDSDSPLTGMTMQTEDGSKPNNDLVNKTKEILQTIDNIIYSGTETSTALATTKQGFTAAELEAQRGAVNPGAAIGDIQKTIEKFKDNAAKGQDAYRLRTQFSGEKNVRIAQDAYLLDSLKKIVPNVTDQEALTLYRTFKDDPQALKDFYTGTGKTINDLVERFKTENPKATETDINAYRERGLKALEKVRPLILQALAPNALMHAADTALTDYSKNKLTEGQENKFLDSSIKPENYVPQYTQPKNKSLISKFSGGKFDSKFTHAMKRKYPSPLHALFDGATPKSLNAIDNFRIYSDLHATQMATVKFLNILKEEQLANFNIENAPRDWEQVNYGRGQSVFLPKDMATAVKPLLVKGDVPISTWVQNLKTYQSFVKSVEVSSSIFHTKALGFAAAADLNPMEALKGFKSAQQDTSAFKEKELDMIKHGGTSPILGGSIKARQIMNKEMLPTHAELKNAPGIKQLAKVTDAITRVTFDIQLRNYKVMGYAMKTAAWIAKNPAANTEELYNAKVDIAKHINSIYGGLNWESLGISQRAREIAKLFVFAPDWLYSQFVSAKYALFDGGPAGTASRSYWFKAIIGGMIASELLSKLIGGKFTKIPFRVYLGKDHQGKDMFVNWFFFGGPGDLATWLNNIMTDGLPRGTLVTLANKTQAVPRAILHGFANKNYLGQDITIKGASPLVNTARSVIEFGSETLPIPFSVADVYKYATDPTQKAELWDYLNILQGDTTQHVIPEGERQVTSGKKKGRLVPDTNANRPQKSFLDQLKGTSIYQPKKK